MAEFVGRSGNLILFTSGEQGVVVDSTFNLVVASGQTELIRASHEWADGEYSERDEETANVAFTEITPLPPVAPTGRLYTVPRGVRNTAAKALAEHSGTGTVAKFTAQQLASQAQVPFATVEGIARHFAHVEAQATVAAAYRETPAVDALAHALWGGDAARRWSTAIVSREPVVAAVEAPEFTSADDDSTEFIARVRMDGTGIDRLYRVDGTHATYLWDDGSWSYGGEDGIYGIDRTLDAPTEAEVGKTHVAIDPASAVVLSARFTANPYAPVSIEDIDSYEAALAVEAGADERADWDMIDFAVTAAAPVQDATPGVYDPEERSANASKQVRDKNGKFATVGQRVVIGGDPAKGLGSIKSLDPANKAVTVTLENGADVTVPANTIEPAESFKSSVAPAAAPGPSHVVDTSGILGEPRRPLNQPIANIPGTLPPFTTKSLHGVLSDWPGYVKEMRDGYTGDLRGQSVPVKGKDSLDIGKNGEKLEKTTGTKLLKNAYDHPLIKKWLEKQDRLGHQPNKLWWNPITASITAAVDAAVDKGKDLTPETSDVNPVYMAVVDPEDPRAVLKLISLVPASSTSGQPMTYSRKDGEWGRDPKALMDLQSATPPPVVPLDDETLNDVLKQVDATEGVEEAPADAPVEEAVPVAASLYPRITLDHAITVLYGTQPKKLTAALIAAGGLDRNKGNAEELRHYWTHGAGAAKIRWGTPGDWKRCVRYLGKHMGERAKGYCQLRHEEATGISTREHAKAAASTLVSLMETGTERQRLEVAKHVLEASNRELSLDDIMSESIEEFDIPQDIIEAMSVVEPVTAAGGLDRNRGGAEKLRRYWTHGPGAAKIAWGTPGDWTRCVRHLGKYLGPRAKGYCNLRHKEMTHMYPGDKRNIVAAASDATIIEYATLRARAADVKERMASIVAGGAETAVRPDGAAFVIPLVIPHEMESGDGRFIKRGALSTRDLPLPLMWQIKTASGHDGSVVVGRIDSIDEVENGLGNARGVFDTGPYGREAERLVRGQFLKGVSGDMDRFEAQAEDNADDEKPLTGKQPRMIINKARIMGATIVPKPAFQECQIFLTEETETQEDELIPDGIYVEENDPIEAAALLACGFTAGAIPVTPPKAWFSNPELEGPTPLTIDDDGRVFGHIAAWHVDHIGLQFGTKPPRSASGYAYFHTGVIRTEEKTDIPVGQLTLSGGHASLNASATEAVKHYDDTKSAIADVHAGEDRFGIWVAGALRPGASPEDIRALRASAPSGDWRPIRGKLELVAVCQVNVPGFPTARARVASGQVMALVAAGAGDLAKLKHDPYEDMFARLEKLEQFQLAEYSAQIDAARAKFALVKAERAAELAAKVNSLSEQFSVASDFAFVPKAKRDEAAKKGHALPDGSFPIETVADLKKAIHAYGRAKNKAAARKHIMKRARALGQPNLVPEEWKTAALDSITASAASIRERATFASEAVNKKKLEELEKIARERGVEIPDAAPAAPPVAPTDQVKTENKGVVPDNTPVQPVPGQKKGIYTAKTQPRDSSGRFRLVLARLKENLGVSGGQAVVEKIKEAENLDNTGNYEKAAKSAVDLISIVDRIDTKALNPQSLENVRSATKELGEVIANLPLPFDNQAEKVRYSDLPPALRDLIENILSKVEDKIGTKDAAVAAKELKSFMSGGDFYSQGEVSSQINKMLRLLT